MTPRRTAVLGAALMLAAALPAQANAPVAQSNSTGAPAKARPAPPATTPKNPPRPAATGPTAAAEAAVDADLLEFLGSIGEDGNDGGDWLDFLARTDVEKIARARAKTPVRAK